MGRMARAASNLCMLLNYWINDAIANVFTLSSQTAIYAQGVGLGASKGKEIGKYADGYTGYVHMAQDAVSVLSSGSSKSRKSITDCPECSLLTHGFSTKSRPGSATIAEELSPETCGSCSSRLEGTHLGLLAYTACLHILFPVIL